MYQKLSKKDVNFFLISTTNFQQIPQIVSEKKGHQYINFNIVTISVAEPCKAVIIRIFLSHTQRGTGASRKGRKHRLVLHLCRKTELQSFYLSTEVDHLQSWFPLEQRKWSSTNSVSFGESHASRIVCRETKGVTACGPRQSVTPCQVESSSYAPLWATKVGETCLPCRI